MTDSVQAAVARIQLPRKVSFLLDQARRYKVLYGGRDAVKSHSVCRAALVRGITKPTKFLCGREILKSVDESIYALLSGLVTKLGLEYFYEVKRDEILGRYGTQAWGTKFVFTGLRFNVSELKSYEDFDVAIVEEANNVSLVSWDTLIFTIRKEGSEIWVTFNPELETDETFRRFITNPPEDAIVVHLTWRDNPWPSTVLSADREKMRAERPDDYNCIWEGRPRTTLADAIYAEEMKAAERDGRITKVPYDPSAAVHTFWDLGYGNHTSIWCGQRVALEWRMLKYLENSNKFLPYYIGELQKLSYVWGTDYLPHDGESKSLGADSIRKQMEDLNREVEVLPNDSILVGINAARNVFPSVYFDREGCDQGIQCLRHYRWKKNTDGIVVSKEPLHDEWSDGADGFRTFAMARNKAVDARRRAPRGQPGAGRAVRARGAGTGSGGSWLGR